MPAASYIRSNLLVRFVCFVRRLYLRKTPLPKPNSERVRVVVPASTANLGSGFDVFSLALQSPRIEVEFNSAPSGTRTIIIEGEYAAEISTVPTANPASNALSALVKEFGKPEGYVLRVRGDIPPSKGLGLSGAAAVGAVFCANRYFRLGLKAGTLAQFAAKGEPSQHMDNVAASALGGFNIITRNPIDEKDEITTFPAPKDLGLAILVPNVRKASTEAARQLVPNQIQTTDYVRTLGHAARMSAAFATRDLETILRSLPWDEIVEPARADREGYGKGVSSAFLFEEKKALFQKFHVAETISGAGPSRALWYSLSEDLKCKHKNKIGIIRPAIKLVTDRLTSLGHEVQQVFMTKPSPRGATIL